MLIQPVDYALLVWFALAALSAAYVALDQWRNNPEPSVMRLGFVLVTLYMGPLGLLLYVLADKERSRGREAMKSLFAHCGNKVSEAQSIASPAMPQESF